MLDRILQNLLGNVLKHGKEEARLSFRKEKGQLVLEIANLVKQPIKRIEKLSNRFYSENLSDTEESSGLGLYITEELCHLLGAEMKLSTDGQWLSVFYLLLTKETSSVARGDTFFYRLFFLKTASPLRLKITITAKVTISV